MCLKITYLTSQHFNSVSWLELTQYGLVTLYNIIVNIGSVNGLLPDNTKLLPDSMLIYCQKTHLTNPITHDTYPTMHHFVTEMCTHVHISVTKWCIVGYETVALWNLCNRLIGPLETSLKSYHIKIQTSSLNKMYLIIMFMKCQPFFLSGMCETLSVSGVLTKDSPAQLHTHRSPAKNGYVTTFS